MRPALILIALATSVLLVSAAQAQQGDYDQPVDQANSLWNDGKPEVILGAYFDAAGTDSVLEGDVPDTLQVYITMWNGGLRDEGPIIALEYSVHLPDGVSLVREDLPDYSNMSIGTAEEGLAQAIRDQPGNGLLINTLTLARTGVVPFDSRIRILLHPGSGFLRYVHRWGTDVQDIDVHHMVPQDGILNPKVTSADFKPVKSKR